MDISALRERNVDGRMTVSQLNNYIKSLLDNDRMLYAVSVTGEISNLTDHRSGHLYFSLKDSDAQIKAVMFRAQRSRLKFAVSDGMRVTVRGSVSVYLQSGTVQIYVNSIEPDGVGALYLAYEQLKEKLLGEGLFDEEHKKLLPRIPSKIGVITSPTGAAVRDIINVIGRRFPLADIYLYPSLVQGEHAEDNLILALDYFERTRLVDVIIIGRGGGSIEDLWAFNGERLARKIFDMTIPIISAVGHETDFTICDFVADLRAPTPSAAAEISVPDIRDITISLDNTTERVIGALMRVAERKRERFTRLSEHEIFKKPEIIFEEKLCAVNDSYIRAENLIRNYLKAVELRFSVLAGKTDALSPLAVLKRGYSVVSDGDGVLSSAKSLKAGDKVKIKLSDGGFSATVNSIDEE